MKFLMLRVLPLIFIALFNNSFELFAQFNFLGKPGLVMTPRAAHADSTDHFYVGTSYIPLEYGLNNFMNRIGAEDYFVANLDFTKRLRINAVLTRPRDIPRIGIGDRHIDIQFDLLYQRGLIPNVGLIITPTFEGSAFLNHNAILVSRYFDFKKGIRLEVSSGYGLSKVFIKPFDSRLFQGFENKYQWIDKSVYGNYYLDEFFGGLQLSFSNVFWLSGEYDGRFYNAGASLLLFKKLHLNTRLLGMEAFSYGFGYRFLLKD